MDTETKNFYMMTVEIRILAAVLARIASRSLEDRFNAQGANISGLQYGILRTLASQQMTQSDLSKRFVLDPSTLVPVIQTLERRQLVTRSRDTNDRRRWILSLTPEGKNLIGSVPMFNEDDLLFQCLGDMGSEKTHELLNLLRDVVQRMPEGAAMVESITSHIYSVTHGENISKPHGCDIHHEQKDARSHHRMIRRAERPGRNRNRNQ